MYRLLLLFCTFLIFTSDTWGQQMESPIIFYLKGRKHFLARQIINQTDSSFVIETVENKILQLNKKQVRRIKKTNEYTLILKKAKTIQAKGFYNVTYLSQSFGLGKTHDNLNVSLSGLHLHTINGMQFNQWSTLGLGVGIDLYPTYFNQFYEEQFFIPVYVDVRGYLNKNTVSPFYSLGMGYGFGVDYDRTEEWAVGGWYIHPQLGVKFASRHLANFKLGIGVRFQQFDFSKTQNEILVVSKGYFRRMDLVYSWMF